MNERIKQFAQEAGFKVDWQHKDVQAIKMERFEKFSELIIMECAEFARQHNLQKADRSHMIHQAMKEHFGVGK